MKCASCGNEFGNGASCQYCGVDRVTGLGNYSGYSPTKNIPQSATYTESHSNTYQEPSPVEDKNIICYNCGEVIPKDSKFCPYCSTNLYVTCPECGKEYSSQFPACSECGTNRDDYYRMQREDRKREALAKEYTKKWEEILEKDPEGKEYEKIKDDQNIPSFERYIAGKVVERKRFSEKWEKIFEQDPEGKEYEKIWNDYTISWEEKEFAKEKYRSEWRRKWENIIDNNPEDKEYGKVYGDIQELTIIEEKIVAREVYSEKLEKKRQEEIKKRQEKDKLIEKWIKILEKDSDESEYNRVQNNKDASIAEKEAATKAKERILSKKSRKLHDIVQKIDFFNFSEIIETVYFVTIIPIAILSFFISMIVILPLMSNMKDPLLVKLLVCCSIALIPLLIVVSIFEGLKKLFESFNYDDYVNEKRRQKALKRYIKEHPNDPDIDFLRKHTKVNLTKMYFK